MKFSYTALNSSNQKMEGILEADSMILAKEELHKMELAILEIHGISEQEYERDHAKEDERKATTGVMTFVFEAVDPAGKNIGGTIEAADDVSACRRLISDYHFKIKTLSLEGAKKDEAKASAERLALLLKELEKEGVTSDLLQKKEEWNEEEIELNQEIFPEIDKTIAASKRVMTEHSGLFTTEKLGLIQKTTEELERIRTSNNLKHIADVSHELLTLIETPDHPSKVQGIMGAEVREAIETIKKSKWLAQGKGTYKKTFGLEKIRAIFDRLKKIPLPSSRPGLSRTGLTQEITSKKPLQKHDFSGFFREVQNFMAWLLCFYLLYLFLVSFSLEKGVGLPERFVIKTLRSPLIVDLTLGLLVSHFLLRIKLRKFHQNGLGSLFLFLLGYGLLTLVLLNF